MANIAELIEYLESSMYTPLLEADPAYLKIKADLGSIINHEIRKRGYILTELPSQDEGAVILYAKKEVYMRLAVSTAPNYDMEAEFTKLLKSKRFDHYIDLVEAVQKDIEELRKAGQMESVRVADVTLSRKDGTYRNYALAQPQTLINVSATNITQNTADLDWTLFDLSKSGFLSYDIIASSQPVYDPYEMPPVNYSAEQVIKVTDVQRTKFRLKTLTPNTHYYVAVVYCASNGRFNVAQVDFTTLA